MGVRQVQIIIEKGALRNGRIPNYVPPSGNLQNVLKKGAAAAGRTPYSNSIDLDDDTLVHQIMSLLEQLRKPHCIMPLYIKGENHIIIQFRSEQKHLSDTILALQGMGIGTSSGTRIDINELCTSIPFPEKKKKKRKYKWDDRMTKEEIFEAIDSQAHLTFDYVAMTFVASLISAVGLLTNSSVTVVASMLVSPLMGPIIAITFGIVTWDRAMVLRGARNELAGVLLCVGVGLLVGACTGKFYGFGQLDSQQITSRGNFAGVLSGVFVAIPSGMGVALALTGGGINALVGVAISAALLPPIVNSGLCLALSVWFEGDTQGDRRVVYRQYSMWSFLLFIANFMLIVLLALCIFKLKRLGGDQREELRVWSERVARLGESTNFQVFASGPMDTVGSNSSAVATAEYTPLEKSTSEVELSRDFPVLTDGSQSSMSTAGAESNLLPSMISIN